MKKLLTVLVLLALLAAAGAALAEEDAPDILGKPFPDFTATDTQGNTFTLSEALKDHEAVVINIWATWCPPCEYEMPFLNKAYEQYRDRVAFIALSREQNDTTEIIEAYRREHGLSFPMGRDEDSRLYQYCSGVCIPATVIVDRYGNAGFVQIGCFSSEGEIMRTIGAFLGDGYTESAALTEIPPESSTRAFPVSAKRGVYVENENAAPVYLYADGSETPVVCYIVPDGPAHIRLELSGEDNPGRMMYYELWGDPYVCVTDLLDPERNAFACDNALEGTYDGVAYHYNYGALYNRDLGGADPDIIEYYLVADEKYLEEVEDDLRTSGAQEIRREKGETVEEGDGPEAYIIRVIDQAGNPVAEVTVNFCTDISCTPCESDENGTITFNGTPGVYHVQLIDVPEGYSYDEEFEMYTGNTYGEWLLRIRKN